MDISALGPRLHEAFRAACRHGASQTNLDIAGHAVRIHFADEALREVLLPSLRGLVAEPARCAASPSVSIHAWVGEEDSPPCPEIVAELARYPDTASVINDGARHLQYNPDGQILSYIDTESGEAYYFTTDETRLPDYELCAPMRVLLNWICAKHGILMVHAAAVGRNGMGVLVIGKSGAGKSTTALQGFLEGLDCLGDDYVAVNPDDLLVYPLYRGCKIMDDALRRLPAFEPHVIARNGPSRKNIVILDETLGSLPPSLRAVALVRPRVSHALSSTFVPMSPFQALAEFAASTILQTPGTGSYMLRDLAQLCTKIPGFYMDLSTEPHEIAASLASLLEQRADT